MNTPASQPPYPTDIGEPRPLGATLDKDKGGVNFSLFSEHATGVTLLLFDAHDPRKVIQEIRLSALQNRTHHYWHVFVRGLKAGIYYAYRVDGPKGLADGHRFNSNKVLLDPYARGITRTRWNRDEALGDSPNLESSMRSVVIDTEGYDWEGDKPLRHKLEDTIIYEMHVRGFTQSPTSKVQHRGTFDGIIEKIGYLKDLGITAVELMPVFEFDSTDVVGRDPNGKALTNYWGFSPIGFFAPESSYCVHPENGSQLREFRDMVKALHQAGIEVILDVVFNHTAEGNHQGPTISFKGIDNSVYYFLVPWDPQYYLDFAGCGNTFNCNHPIAQKMIVDSLWYWVREMHVDGFRFDAAGVLTRDERGRPSPHSPVIWEITLSDDLAYTKAIAEPWDIHVMQLGSFPGLRWLEWNACFRDDIRRFVKGEPGVNKVSTRLAGSEDLFQRRDELPTNSINFVTSHDGFTLNDLVSYDQKNNWANGECNRDGDNNNLSWNCGAEGDRASPDVEELRKRQIRNFAALLLLSRGVPMFVAGDEVRRTQKGNNNAYCQDNEISWFDWRLVEENEKLLRFWQLMIKFRKDHAALRCGHFFTGDHNERGVKDVEWYGTSLASAVDLNDRYAHALGMLLAGFNGDSDLYVMMNMYHEDLEFELPPIDGWRWHRAVDTARKPPGDIAEPGNETPVPASTYTVHAHSVVVLLDKPPEGGAGLQKDRAAVDHASQTT